MGEEERRGEGGREIVEIKVERRRRERERGKERKC